MKRILLGLVIAGVIGGIAYATNAYFSDTEKSSNNTFVAGELDLKFQVNGAVAPWVDVNGNPLFDGVTFPLSDLKPGDKGEKTVRLWVDDNPSCGKVSVNVTEDKDNSCTGPESLVDPDGPTCGTLGELNDQVNFAVWEDPNCNNVLDSTSYCANIGQTTGCEGANGEQGLCELLQGCKWVPTETIAVSGPIAGTKAYSIGELPVTQANAKCYGVAYCMGTWNGTTCDGTAVNNAAQSDSFKADLIINALQKRNQFPNGCPTIGDWVD